jgi:uncharacterized damage-inducible protein DinB
MSARDLMLDLYRHMEWADAAMWDAVAAAAAGSDPALLERLHHLHQVQRSFLSMWRGDPIDRRAGEGRAGAELASWARTYYADAAAHIAALSDEALAAPAAIPWTKYIAERLGREPSPASVGDTILQVYAHTAHHRGQIMSSLRAAHGVTPPTIDYIAWIWQGRPAAQWTVDCGPGL